MYSAVPASLVGREQQIDVGPMSGKSNVRLLARAPRHSGERRAVDRIFARAKRSATVLTESEIRAEIDAG